MWSFFGISSLVDSAREICAKFEECVPGEQDKFGESDFILPMIERTYEDKKKFSGYRFENSEEYVTFLAKKNIEAKLLSLKFNNSIKIRLEFCMMGSGFLPFSTYKVSDFLKNSTCTRNGGFGWQKLGVKNVFSHFYEQWQSLVFTFINSAMCVCVVVHCFHYTGPPNKTTTTLSSFFRLGFSFGLLL